MTKLFSFLKGEKDFLLNCKFWSLEFWSLDINWNLEIGIWNFLNSGAPGGSRPIPLKGIGRPEPFSGSGRTPNLFLHPDPRLKKPSVSCVASSSECFLEGWQNFFLLETLFCLVWFLFFHYGVQKLGLRLENLFYFLVLYFCWHAPGGSRTPNLLLRRQPLSPVELPGQIRVACGTCPIPLKGYRASSPEPLKGTGFLETL